MTREEIIDFCEMKSQLEPENEDIFNYIIKALKQEPILDKIRAEIDEEKNYAYADFDRYKEDILHAESDELPDDDFRYGLCRTIEIIDKYKTE